MYEVYQICFRIIQLNALLKIKTVLYGKVVSNYLDDTNMLTEQVYADIHIIFLLIIKKILKEFKMVFIRMSNLLKKQL